MRAEFHLTRATLQNMMETMESDMEKGLEGGIAKSTISMLPSFVPEMPTGEGKSSS